MTLKRVAIGLLLLATTSAAIADGPTLKPRATVQKLPGDLLRMPEVGTGEITVKFADHVRARVTQDGHVISLSQAEISEAVDIIVGYELDVRSAFNQSPDRLAALEERARQFSGREQPDLAGMLKLAGDPGTLLTAARELNELDVIEFVQIDGAALRTDMDGRKVYSAGVGMTPVPRRELVQRSRAASAISKAGQERRFGGGDEIGGTGACCLGGNCSDGLTANECVTAGGIYMGDGTTCAGIGDGCLEGACCVDGGCQVVTKFNCENTLGGTFAGAGTNCDDEEICELEDCGDPAAGSCFDQEGNGTAYCELTTCCQLICDTFDPYCCDEDNGGVWDEFCAAQANLTCAIADGADRCNSPLNGSCFIPHITAGCRNQTCCEAVELIDPFCSQGIWDAFCVQIAYTVCQTATDPAAATPDYESLQGYLHAPTWGADELAALAAYIPTVGGAPWTGYDGSGWQLEGVDGDDDGFPDDPYAGLRGLGADLLDNYGVDATGEGNLTTGNTMKVAVLWDAYWADHEDLPHVVSEPDQTLITIQDVGQPDFGTADLVIIGGDDDGEGCVGIVPDAELYFFPLVSVEEGPREPSAWFSAMEGFQPGDVIFASYEKVAPIYNPNCDASVWTLIRLASDLGLNVVVMAGDACADLAQAPDLGESGAIVVGATAPGAIKYRIPPSNYCVGPTLGASNIIHLSAWGDTVVTGGFGDFFIGEVSGSTQFLARAYTAAYGGTAAAGAQISGLIAACQGLAKQFYGIALMPEKMRDQVMKAPGIPPTPPPRLFGGFGDGQGCGLDLDPDAGPNQAGFPAQARASATEVIDQITAGFTQAPLVDDVIVVKGNLIYGSKYSVKGDDQNYLVVEAVPVGRGSGGSGYTLGQGGHYGTGSFGSGAVGPASQFAAQLAQLQYPTSGDMTDVVIVGTADIEGVQSMGAVAQFAYPGVFTMVFVEAYDWMSNRWNFAGFATMPGPAVDDWTFGFPLGPLAKRYVRSTDDRILFRIWTIGLTFPGEFGVSEYRNRIDLFDIQVSEQFGEGLP